MRGLALFETFNLAGIPRSMREADGRWNVWRYETRAGETKPTKVPYQLSGKPAAVTRPHEWTDFTAAAAWLVRMRRASGLAFRLGDGWAGIDIDGCRDPHSGRIAGAAAFLMHRFQTYGEVSPSGTGIKLFLRLPGESSNGRSRLERPWPGMQRIEVYTHDRYFTVTGLAVPGLPNEVTDAFGPDPASRRALPGQGHSTSRRGGAP